jgi:hypothetical protein
VTDQPSLGGKTFLTVFTFELTPSSSSSWMLPFDVLVQYALTGEGISTRQALLFRFMTPLMVVILLIGIEVFLADWTLVCHGCH